MTLSSKLKHMIFIEIEQYGTGEEIPCRCLHKLLVDPIYKVASSWKYQRTLVGHVGPFDLLSDSFPNIRCR